MRPRILSRFISIKLENSKISNLQRLLPMIYQANYFILYEDDRRTGTWKFEQVNDDVCSTKKTQQMLIYIGQVDVGRYHAFYSVHLSTSLICHYSQNNSIM